MRDYLIGEGRLFEPDTLLPSQFFATMAKRTPQQAEYRLVVAVLQDAVECFQKHLVARDHKARQLFDDAALWLASDDRTWPYSFLNICDLLGLNPHYVRNGLRQWTERRAPGRLGLLAATMQQRNEPEAEEALTITAEAS